MKKAEIEAAPVMRKISQKLSMVRLFDEAVEDWSEQMASPSIHFFSINFMAGPCVTLKMALDISATRGEPMGKTCKI